jgi:SAM-dependent methyltransferase
MPQCYGPPEPQRQPTTGHLRPDDLQCRSAYTAESDTGIQNAYYERPAILALAGEVTGRRVLDASCGSGPLFAALRDRGAIVTGIDASTGMLEAARRRLGDAADLQLADLGRPRDSGSPS